MARSRSTRRVSAGLILYRRSDFGQLEVFLAHPGGPHWYSKDAGHWTIPKGECNPNESLFEAAIREFMEETGLPTPQGPFLELGSILQKGGKIVHAWASPGDADPALIQSNRIIIEWPPRSGRELEIPEVDRCDWFLVEKARTWIKATQAPLIDRLEALAR